MNQSDMILSELVTNSDYARAVLPHLKEEYFSDRSQKILFKEVEQFIQKYNGLPSKEALLISMQSKELDETLYEGVTSLIEKIEPSENNLQWLIDSTEKYCKEKAVYNALMESLNIIDDKSKTKTREAIPGLLQEALSVGFNKQIGHDYLNQWESRFAEYTQNVVKIPFDIELLNAATDGGIERKTLNLILAGTYVGKAQPTSTVIPTPVGYRKMGDLQVGDYVFGSNGKPTLVTGVFPQGIKDVYRITFSDGRRVECCNEHLWNVMFKRQTKFKTLELKQFASRVNSGGYVSIPTCEPVDYQDQQNKIHPYMMGLLIGDGTLINQIGVSAKSPEIINWLHNNLIKGHRIRKLGNDYYIASDEGGKSDNAYINELKNMNLYGKKSYEKFIPQRYMLDSTPNRVSLLRGLLDTDGTVGKTGHVSYSTTSYRLANDVALLVRSLGGQASIKHRTPTFTYNNVKKQGRVAYNVSIFLDRDKFELFTVSKKLERYKQFNQRQRNLRMINVELVGQEPCVCISVDAPDHLYLTNDYTVTHNTLQMCHFASSYLLRGYNVLYITMEIAESKIAQRIDANLLNCEMSQLKHMPEQTYANRIAALKRRVVGQLVVKEFPTSVPNILHFKALLEELKVKKNFVPDIICIDYLNICSSSRYRAGGNTNSYTYVKAIAEELRGLAVETNTAIWSATQTNREGFASSDVDMTDTSESFGVPMTADLLYAAISTPELRELNQYLIKMLKNRYFDSDKFQKFVIGVDRPKMRLYNVEQSAQLDEPLFDKTGMGAEIQSRTKRGRKPKASNNFGEVINEAMEGLIDD